MIMYCMLVLDISSYEVTRNILDSFIGAGKYNNTMTTTLNHVHNTN